MSDTVGIPLGAGYTAIVDTEDAPLVAGVDWYPRKAGQRVYATAPHGGKNMHEVIHPCPNGLDVDHKDRDGLNNRRKNLRCGTRSQNIANAGLSRANRTGYRGVGWYAASQKWRTKIMCNYRTIHVGYFATKEEAARAYDRKARELFGEFAYQNFPEDHGSGDPLILPLTAQDGEF